MDTELLERIILDPDDSPLEITGGRVPDSEGHGIGLLEVNFPRPEVQQTWAGSRNTEGEVRYGEPRFMNRKVSGKVWLWEGRGIGPAINLAANPSFELDPAGWSTSGGALTAGGVLDRVENGWAGEWCGRVTAGAANRGAGITVPLLSGSTFIVRFAARSVSGNQTLTVARGTSTVGSVTLTDTWQMFELSMPGAAGNQFLSFRLAGVGVFELDALLAAEAGAGLYFDGDTPGCRWTGAPHQSASERVGSGENLKRMIKAGFDLQSKLEKFARHGGTIRRYLGDGTAVTLDVVDATYPANWQRTISQGKLEMEFELTCKPFVRLPAVTLPPAASVGSTVTIDTGRIPGNAPALARLKLSSPSRRSFVAVGVGSTGGLLKADTRKVLSGSKVASPGGSINGSQVVRGDLQPVWQPYVATTASDGTFETHRGIHRIYGRVRVASAAQVRLEWAQADLSRWVRNDPVTVQPGEWTWVDLGMVNLDAPGSTPWRDEKGWRWEGRLCGMSTETPGNLWVDAIDVCPASDVFAELQPLTVPATAPEAVLGMGVAAGSTGSLNGKSAVIGGTWGVQAGSGPDFTLPSDTWIFRGNSGEGVKAAESRTALLGTGVAAGIQGQVHVMGRMQFFPLPGMTGMDTGVMVRWVNASNYVRISRIDIAPLAGSPGNVGLRVSVVVANNTVKSAVAYFGHSGEGLTSTLEWQVTTTGDLRAAMTVGDDRREVAFNDAVLATGGAVASGRFGLSQNVFGDGGGSAFWSEPTFRQLTTPADPDAVIYPGRSALVNHDIALREDAAGGSYGTVGRYAGDRLLIPAGAGRRLHVLHGGSVGQGEDTIPSMSAELSYVPRVVDFPEPA